MTNPLTASAGQRIDRYVIEGTLGSGSFGAVYRARHLHLLRPVALKVLRRDRHGSQDALARFFREAKTLASIGSPHIVEVLDSGTAEDGHLFIAMELLEGVDLETHLHRAGGTLPVGETLRIAEHVLAGLSVAHAHGVVHRDLKPANVFLSASGAKILDFGVSKVRAAEPSVELTRTGMILGTPRYMAPEQFSSTRDVDARADLYSLGAIVYRLLAGRPAFPTDDYGELLRRVQSERPAPLSVVAPHVSPSLSDAIDRALARDRDARFESAEAFAVALRFAAEAPMGTRELHTTRSPVLGLPSATRPEVIPATASLVPHVSPAPSVVPSPESPTVRPPTGPPSRSKVAWAVTATVIGAAVLGSAMVVAYTAGRAMQDRLALSAPPITPLVPTQPVAASGPAADRPPVVVVPNAPATTPVESAPRPGVAPSSPGRPATAPRPSPPTSTPTSAGSPRFVESWLHGVDTTQAAKLSEFHQLGANATASCAMRAEPVRITLYCELRDSGVTSCDATRGSQTSFEAICVQRSVERAATFVHLAEAMTTGTSLAVFEIDTTLPPHP